VQRGILGGTFDPPHLAHLFAGEAAYRDLNLDVVTFIPAGAPWQKAGQYVTGGEDRWRMVQLAVAAADYFEADDREVRRDGWTYTADTLASFDPGDEITLVLGADAAKGIMSWQRSEDILKRVRVAVIPRPRVDRNDVDWVLRGHRYEWLDTPELVLSGTILRERAATGRSLRFLVPDSVWEYIREHHLYGAT
jgi:nicotinate-nucleotide adenylyltransferase